MYADELGFDGLMLNEHHSTPFCMQGVTNVEAAILARQTKKAKIVIMGNVLPIWDDPLWLAEQFGYDRRDLTWPPDIRIRARRRAREREPQFSSSLQP